MPEYLHPGVYIEEIERGPRPIEGVPTSTAAFLGETERGPIEPTPGHQLQGISALVRRRLPARQFLPYAVNGFFENGGKRVYICRIVGQAATTASAAMGDNFIVQAVRRRRLGPARLRPNRRQHDPGARRRRRQAADRLPAAARLLVQHAAGLRAVRSVRRGERDDAAAPVLCRGIRRPGHRRTSPDFYGKRFPFIDREKGDKQGGPRQLRPGGARSQHRRIRTAPGRENGATALTEGGADDAEALGPDDYVGLPDGDRTELQGLAALELDPYRDVALVYAPAVAQRHRAEDHQPLRARSFRFAVIDSPNEPAAQRSRPAHDPADRHAIRRVLLSVDRHLRPADGRAQARPARRPRARHLRAHRQRARRVQGAGQRDGARRARPRIRHQRRARRTCSTRAASTPSATSPAAASASGARARCRRTRSGNTVSVRRLFIFLERSIYEGTQWVVFEPNDDAAVGAGQATRSACSCARSGATARCSAAPRSEAFFITCDRTTMIAGRHPQRPADLRDRHRAGPPGRVRHLPHLPAHR